MTTATLSLLDRLDAGPVVCAEGCLVEFERRGYLQAGPFVPEIVLEHPDLGTDALLNDQNRAYVRNL